MANGPVPLDLKQLKVFPLASRKSMAAIEDILVPPESAPPPCSAANERLIEQCAQHLRRARQRGASVMLLYGAHLVKNGGAGHQQGKSKGANQGQSFHSHSVNIQF